MTTNLSENTPPRATKGRGRPAYFPNEQHRAQVRVMAGHGLTQDKIAKSLAISEPTLRKHHRADLSVAAEDLRKAQAPTPPFRCSSLEVVSAHCNEGAPNGDIY